jgi:hypothetical protein
VPARMVKLPCCCATPVMGAFTCAALECVGGVRLSVIGSARAVCRWTGMLLSRARWGRAAEATARGSAVRGAAATIARRAGASKYAHACIPAKTAGVAGLYQQGPPGQLGRCCSALALGARLPGPAAAQSAAEAGASREQTQQSMMHPARYCARCGLPRGRLRQAFGSRLAGVMVLLLHFHLPLQCALYPNARHGEQWNHLREPAAGHAAAVAAPGLEQAGPALHGHHHPCGSAGHNGIGLMVALHWQLRAAWRLARLLRRQKAWALEARAV